MRNERQILLLGLFYICILLVTGGCDVVKNDVAPKKAFMLKNDSLTTFMNSPGEINVLLNDIISEEATVSIGQPTHGVAELIEDGVKLVYTPTTDYLGLDSLTYRVCVGTNCRSARVFLEVLPVCQTELIRYTLDKNQGSPSFSIPANKPCVNGTFKLVRAPQHGTATLDLNWFSYTPSDDFVGQDSLTIYAECQESAECYTVTYAFRVKDPANCQFKAFDDRATIWENSEFINQVSVRMNDDTCGAVTTAITQMPAHGAAKLDEFRHINYVPNKNYVGPDQLTYTICNMAGQCSSATVYYTVKKDVDFESCKTTIAAKADKVTVTRNNTSSQEIEIDVLANDVLCGTNMNYFTIEITKQPQQGTIIPFSDDTNRPKFRYETTAKGPAADTFSYRICYISQNLIDEVCKEAEVEITIQ